MDMVERAAYPLDEASRLAGGISRGTWYNLEARGQVRLVRIGRRVLVPASEIERLTGVDRWVDEHTEAVKTG